MDDLPSEDVGTQVPGETALGDMQGAPPSNSPDGSSHTGTIGKSPAALDFDATVIAAPPFRTSDMGAIGQEALLSNATIVGGTSPISKPEATIASPPSTRQSGPSNGANSRGANAILLEVGTILGNRYEILQLLGEGGMGAVYKAADREVDRNVALKVIRPEMASNPEILARFKQELLLSSKVTHRNVIRIYDLGEAQGVKFITMEFMEGETLHQILKSRKKLEIAEAVDIMEQVASGLAAAHGEGIIHRDLKPANIMVDKNGRVVVMDFGLARTFSGDGMTQTGTMLGTIEYMSPEQAQGMDVKASSDIFTVGLMLYELLAGTTPFCAESAIASLLMRTQQRAAPLVSVDKNIPSALSNIVVKCLEKDPVRRYQSAEHLDADLLAWQGRTGGTRVSAPSTRIRVDQMRGLPWLRIGITGFVVVVIGAASAWYLVHKRESAQSLAHLPVSVLIGDFANHTGDSVLDNTLEPMLGVAMEGASFINVFSRGDARKLAKKLPNPTDVLDEQASRLVAINQGVNAVITGDISRRGEQYDISAVALDTHTGDVLAKADVIANSKQEILSELPKLAVPIRKAMGDTTASTQFEKVSGGFTAKSLEAVHQDSLGVEAQFAGKYQEAFDAFEKSAKEDPQFARAYTGMAAMALNLGRPADAAKYMKMAMANSDRMTERERYRNLGSYYYLATGEWQKCVDQYTQLIARYPADRVGQNNLASCYTQLRNAPKALEAAKHAVEIVPKGVGQRLNLAFIEAFSGDFAASEKEARAALEISPTASQGDLVLAEAQLGQGHLSEAINSYHQLERSSTLGASTAADGLADLAAYQGNYGDAVRILTQGIATDTPAKMTDHAARKYASLADIELSQGHQALALADLGKALVGSPSTPVQFLAAIIYAETGDLAKAQKLAIGLASQASTEPQAYAKIIAGLMALKRKDEKEATKQITAANSLLDTWIGHFELGRAYLEAGAFTEADAEFAKCINRRGEVVELFDDNVPTYSYFPAVYYYQGQARAEMKIPTFADSYKEYLKTRGQAADDPLIPEIHHLLGQ